MFLWFLASASSGHYGTLVDDLETPGKRSPGGTARVREAANPMTETDSPSNLLKRLRNVRTNPSVLMIHMVFDVDNPNMPPTYITSRCGISRGAPRWVVVPWRIEISKVSSRISWDFLEAVPFSLQDVILTHHLAHHHHTLGRLHHIGDATSYPAPLKRTQVLV